ncbi:MAG: hypothetical protein ACWA6U_18185 [Breznakibacter sp.]
MLKARDTSAAVMNSLTLPWKALAALYASGRLLLLGNAFFFKVHPKLSALCLASTTMSAWADAQTSYTNISL